MALRLFVNLSFLGTCLAQSNGISFGYEVARHTDPRRLLEVMEAQGGHDEVATKALEVSRKLFDFASMADSIGGAAKWATDTVSEVQNKVVGVQEAATLIQGANGYVQEGTQLTGQAWDSMKGLGDKMGTIYQDFEPLEPAFASASGVAQITTDEGFLSKLVHCIREIISSNSILDILGSALEKVIGIFTQIKDAVVSIVSKLGGGRRLRQAGEDGRRLLDYSQLLEGIDFEWLGNKITGFVADIKKQSENLVDIDTILGPMLSKMDKTGEAVRRLDFVTEATNSITDAANVKEQADKNARAIGKIIPTWQAVEGTAVNMCPSVLATKDTMNHLSCRTTEFVSQAGLSSFVPSQVTDIVGNCPADLPTTEQAVAQGCPAEAKSANVSNVLGEHAQKIGWAMAVGGGALGLGVCGGGAAMLKSQMSKDEDTSDDEEDDESENQTLNG
ncbi:unnamed protein product [Symbiodinium natans]|uniref:Uncharacterized protein n=1 Tax=Symbiodinium natans TaxID=878477 RepID=A0A812Q1C7_9DINO|nr:unnamed protein product [Symbiodinium natans]